MKKLFSAVFVLFPLLFTARCWAVELVLVNSGFEQPTDRPTGWRVSQHAGAVAYETGLDDQVFAEGRHSFRMKRLTPQVYGLVDQIVSAPRSGGRSMRLSAMLRTEEVGPMGWMLVVNFLGESDGILGQARSEPMSGTKDWQRVSLEHEVPTGTVRLAVGAMLLDSGTGWVDQVTLSLGED